MIPYFYNMWCSLRKSCKLYIKSLMWLFVLHLLSLIKLDMIVGFCFFFLLLFGFCFFFPISFSGANLTLKPIMLSSMHMDELVSGVGPQI